MDKTHSLRNRGLYLSIIYLFVEELFVKIEKCSLGDKLKVTYKENESHSLLLLIDRYEKTVQE